MLEPSGVKPSQAKPWPGNGKRVQKKPSRLLDSGTVRQSDSGKVGQVDKWERIAIRARIVSVRFESLVRRIGAINLSIAVLTVALALALAMAVAMALGCT